MPTKKEWTLAIEGMTCEHCARSIDEALAEVDGVVECATSFAQRHSRVVAAADVDPDELARAVAAEGYRVVRVEPGPSAGRGDGSERPTATASASAERRSPRAPASGRDIDLLVLGAGSAGFAAAIRADELGARAVIVERGAVGGTCVNVGCVPSKTLIRAAQAQYAATHCPFDGLRIEAAPPDFRAVVEQKRQLVAELQKAKYLDVLDSYPRISLLRGTARFRPDGVVEVDGEPVRAARVLLATGASPARPPIPGIGEAGVLTSTELMELDELPRRLVVIGGGAIGVELGQAFARFGARVTVVEALPRIVPGEDETLSAALEDLLRAEGLEIFTGARVERVGRDGRRRRVAFTDREGNLHEVEADEVVVATGRRPNTAGMGLEEAGIALGEHGEVLVDEYLETTRPGVYAAGDVIGPPAFVYVAAYAGNLAASNALGPTRRRYDVSVVPRVTFTDPAVASVGLTEAQARTRGIDVIVSELPMEHVPRAQAARDTRGLVKLVADARSRQLVGAHILAPEAGDIVEEAVLAMRFRICVDEIAGMFHPYLTHAEAIKLAAQTFDKDVAKLSCCAA